jgi:hypothetical protein
MSPAASVTRADDEQAVGPTGVPARRPRPARLVRPVADALGRHVRRHPVVWTGVALIALQLVFRAVWTYRSWWYADDFVMISRSVHAELNGSFLFQEYIDHLMPGDFLVSWVLSRVAPWEWGAAATVLVVLQLAIDVVLLRLLLRLFGRRPLILVPLAMYLFSTVTVGPALWFASALEWLPMQLALVLALSATVRYARTGLFRYALGTAAAVALGLLFIEKAILLVALVGLFLFLYGTSGTIAERRRGTVERYRPLLALLFAEAAAYTAFYLSSAQPGGSSVGSPGELLRLVKAMVFDSFVPFTFGGPWTWASTAPPVSLPDTPDYAKWLTWQAALVLVVATCWLRRGAWRAWVLLGACLATDIALVAWARFGPLGSVLGLDTRYTSESALVAALCTGLAMMRTLDEPPEAVRAERAGAAAFRAGLRRHRVAVGAVATLVVNFLVFNGVYSGSAYAGTWAANAAKPWVTTLRHDLGRAGTVEMFDVPVPADVVPPLLEHGRDLSEVLAGVPSAPRFVESSERLVTTGPGGHLYRSEVDGVRSAVGPTGGCGWLLDGSGTVRLETEVFEWDWVVKISYLAEADTPAVVRLGKASRRVTLRKGLNDLYVHVVGGKTHSVQFSSLTRGTAVCVDKVTVGNPTPLERLVP